MVNTKNIRKALCEIGKLCYDRGYLDASGGNISIRDGDKAVSYTHLGSNGHKLNE